LHVGLVGIEAGPQYLQPGVVELERYGRKPPQPSIGQVIGGVHVSRSLDYMHRVHVAGPATGAAIRRDPSQHRPALAAPGALEPALAIMLAHQLG
jgi:hypothetical protein